MFETLPDRTGLAVDERGSINLSKPFFPLDTIGLPLPGADFLEHAARLVDEGAIESTVEQLYRLALYSQGEFSIPVQTKYGPRPANFIPGHQWGNRASGPVPSRVFVVGKMPGKEEAEKCRNFCGQSGQLLRQVVESSGISPRDWYITNVVRFLPPDGGTALSARWIKDCELLLHQELRLVRPDFLLCLGSEATKAILGKGHSVTRSSGQVFEIKIPFEDGEHTIQVLVSLHPAAVLHDADQLPQFEQSIRLFAQLVQKGSINRVETDIDHRVIWDECALSALVDELLFHKTTKILAFDCEWHGDAPAEPGSYLRTIQFSWLPKHAACVVLRHQGGGWAFDGDPIGPLKRLVARPGTRIVGHFLRSDLPWMKHAGLDLYEMFQAPVDDPDMTAPGASYGWEKTRDEGGFAVELAAHAHHETGPFGLEVLTALRTTAPRYDIPLENWKRRYCSEHGIVPKNLGGFGACPDETLHPYANYDSDVVRRLFDVYNDKLLDCDEHGNNCRQPFWISMRAIPAILEIEDTGLLIDQDRIKELICIYQTSYDEQLLRLREWSHWPEFNPRSDYQRRELVFGSDYSGKRDPGTGKMLSVAPEGAWSLHAKPIKSTGKPARPWAEAVRDKTHPPSPSTDKEVLGILSSEYEQAGWLRNIRFVGQMLTSVLCPSQTRTKQVSAAIVSSEGSEIAGGLEEELEEYFGKGLLSFVRSDGRVHTTIRQTLETGRCSSSRPPTQALSQRREAQYKLVLAENYRYAIRSVIVAPPGSCLVEADILGAELAVMAWLSGDEKMMDHVARSMLEESDPGYYDIHSNLAVSAFKLNCLPTKRGLEEVGRENLRVAAKGIAFGDPYGRSAAAIQRSIAEEGVQISLEETETMMESFRNLYAVRTEFFEECAARVLDPGWIRGPFGRLRRARPPQNDEQLGELERQFKNFCIQEGVADAIWRGFDHLYESSEHRAEKFKIVLQMHDAVLLEVPDQFVAEICSETLPRCMTRMVPFIPCDLDGRPLPRGPYHFGIEIKVTRKWGEKLSTRELESLGIKK